MPPIEGWIRKIMGEILLNTGDRHISEAENWIIKAIQADKRNDMMFHLARNYALYTELFKRKIKDWKNFFYLPGLVKLSKKRYSESMAYLNTGIPYNIFHRNVIIALENAQKTEENSKIN